MENACESRNFIFTSESVTEGHPDKICDQISDAILDAILEKEAQLQSESYVSPSGVAADLDQVRCAIETLASTGTIIISGEVRTQAYVDFEKIARQVVKEIGFDRAAYGFDSETCGVLSMVHEQSADIAMGVDESYEVQKSGADSEIDPLDLIGAGDQGMMFGFASNETDALMPMPIYLSHRLAERLTKVRKDGILDYLRPDGKTQVSVKYEFDEPKSIDKILISTQHAPEITDMDIIRKDLIEHVITPVLDEVDIEWKDAEIYVNPTGRFVVGGPMGDTGLTGRKIIVDTYGGYGRHGGGAFSGKDCTKVDRSGAYAARWVAKNVVAAGLAKRCEVQFAYAIGVAKPLSIMVDTQGTEREGLCVEDIEAAVKAVFDLRPGAIIRDLKLRRPIFKKTAAYGHFGRDDEDFTWEQTNKVQDLLDYLKEQRGIEL
ncbi:MAG: methionine adenosyltransferase [Coriobacteriia bacterium]|nr:methionine adenosyltransferase [Coriobacteriia bacterium]